MDVPGKSRASHQDFERPGPPRSRVPVYLVYAGTFVGYFLADHPRFGRRRTLSIGLGFGA
eukprot:6179629-Pleurochrysis_carterae.AAC.1